MASRPAVSMMTRSCSDCSAYPRESRATTTGSPTPFPGCGHNTRPGSLRDDLQLVHRVWSLEVGRDKDGLMSLVRKVFGEFACQRRLARALQTEQHDDRGRLFRQPQVAGLTAEDLDEFLVNDLDDLLRRVEAGRHLGPRRPLTHPGGERAHHRQRHIGLKQGFADLPTVSSMSASDSRPFPRRPLKVAAKRSDRELNMHHSWGRIPA